MSFVFAIKDHIVSHSLGTYGTDLFIGGLEDGPDVNDPTVGMVPRGGNPIIETGAPGIQVDTPQLHMAARGTYAATYDRLTNIRNLLVLVVNTSIGDGGNATRFLRIKPRGAINFLERDVQGRYKFTQDFDVML